LPKLHSRRVDTSRTLFYTIIQSPIGYIGIAATPHGICRISLNVRSASTFSTMLREEFDCTPVRHERRLTSVANRLRAYFRGQPSRFRSSLDLRTGTAFQKKVWAFLRKIPYGQTRSYRAVARAIGHPNSFRAVGGACGCNPVGILVPCHRVINTTGEMGGFSGGLYSKRFLLRLEKSRG